MKWHSEASQASMLICMTIPGHLALSIGGDNSNF